jgi:hypothetical protein
VHTNTGKQQTIEETMEDTNLYVNLTIDQIHALTRLEIAVESGIEQCLSEGCNINDIKDTIKTMRRKYESEIARQNLRERIREHNAKVRAKCAT